jgi:hypothetical protein
MSAPSRGHTREDVRVGHHAQLTPASPPELHKETPDRQLPRHAPRHDEKAFVAQPPHKIDHGGSSRAEIRHAVDDSLVPDAQPCKTAAEAERESTRARASSREED